MKLIKPSFEIIEQGYSLDDVYKHIELCGRTCYKSTDKITPESAKPFVDRLAKSQHYAMLEHGTIYLASNREFSVWSHLVERYNTNKYSILKGGLADYDCYVTTNLRVIAENNWWDDLKYICEPTMFHAKRYTVKFICNRQVSHEFVRHRVFSFAQESTRYCNYAKDKFGNELTFIEPCWLYKGEDEYEKFVTTDTLKSELNTIETTYFNLINAGWIPQQAATILPNALKTELIMTGFADDWNHFFRLRSDIAATGRPHPQAEELATPLMKEFIKRGYMEALV